MEKIELVLLVAEVEYETKGVVVEKGTDSEYYAREDLNIWVEEELAAQGYDEEDVINAISEFEFEVNEEPVRNGDYEEIYEVIPTIQDIIVDSAVESTVNIIIED